MSDMRYAILQGVEKTADDPGMHVFAVDSHKHSLELFLRPSEFLPSSEDAQKVGGTCTPVVHAVLGPGMDVIGFGRRLSEAIQRLFTVTADKGRAAFERELDKYQVDTTELSEMTDDLMLWLMIQAVFPAPTETRFPIRVTKDCGEQVLCGLWAAVGPHEAEPRELQVDRLLESWLAAIGEVGDGTGQFYEFRR